MNPDFSRNLLLLRKEKGLSQKKVSEDLDISQALLSHYEKGIRECGLDFVVNAAEYFGVSCDFLLGRTKQREVNRAEKSAKPRGADKDAAMDSINGTVHIVFGILKKINSKCLTEEVTNYLSASAYTMFRMLYSANDKNPQDAFLISQELFTAVMASNMAMSKAKCRSMLSGFTFDGDTKIGKELLPRMSFESIKNDYPKFSPALAELIKKAEKN